jgi:hypothetical protein
MRGCDAEADLSKVLEDPTSASALRRTICAMS